MVGDIASVCGLCICASLMCKITEKHSKEQTVLLVIAVTAMIFFNAADGLPAVLEKMDTLMEYSGLEKDYVSILFKALGVCWLKLFSIRANNSGFDVITVSLLVSCQRAFRCY